MSSVNNKKWYLRWWAFLLYFFVIVGVIGAFSEEKALTTQSEIVPITEKSTPSSQTPPPTQPPQSISNLWRVMKVIDGDTVTVEKDGTSETIRLIGINTPETVDPRKPVECFGQEASSKAKELLTGKQVRLEADPSQGERDKYDRLLRYVFLDDNLSYNKTMIQEGYAYEYTYDKPYKYQGEFKQAEQEARVSKRGLWADGVCGPLAPAVVAPAQATQPSVVPVGEPPKQGEWICSYNAYNCANFKTQAEAQSAFEACGGTNNDIHRLDQDKDGKVCETLP